MPPRRSSVLKRGIKMSASSPNSVFFNTAGYQIYFNPTDLISWDDFQKLQALLRQYPSFLAHRDEEILKNMILRCSENNYQSLILQTRSWMQISRILLANNETREIGKKLRQNFNKTSNTAQPFLWATVQKLIPLDEELLPFADPLGVAESIVYGDGYDQRQKKEAKIMILKKVALGEIDLAHHGKKKACEALLNKNLGLFARKKTQSLSSFEMIQTYQNTTLRMSALILKHSAFSRQEKEKAKVEILKALFSNEITTPAEKQKALELLDIRLDTVFHRGMNGSFAWTCSRACFETFSKMKAESDPQRYGGNEISQQAVQAAKSVSKNLFLVLCDKAKVKCPEDQLKQWFLS